jgi:hypothetical protein
MTVAEIYNHYISDIGELNGASLNRLSASVRQEDFAIISACEYADEKKRNVKLTNQLFDLLNQHQMGGFKLVGHWQEAPEGIAYKDATPDMLVDTIEESVFIAKPEDMDRQVFVRRCTMIAEKLHQNAVIIGLQDSTGQESGGTWLYFQDDSRSKIGNNTSLPEAAQAYSQMNNKPDVPFIFEGFVQPLNNMSKMAFKAKMLLY